MKMVTARTSIERLISAPSTTSVRFPAAVTTAARTNACGSILKNESSIRVWLIRIGRSAWRVKRKMAEVVANNTQKEKTNATVERGSREFGPQPLALGPEAGLLALQASAGNR